MGRIEAAVIGIVIILSLVQIPLDFRTRTLSRRATLFATIAVLLALAVETISSESVRRLSLAAVMTLLVGVAYFLLHRLSTYALGFGDVLLVIPLTLAVAHRGVESMLYWQLLAACTGTLHAVVMRVWRRESSIPFGPHLLLAALAVLVASV